MAAIDFNQEASIRVIPQIGQAYKAKDFSIVIIDKKPSETFEADMLVAEVTGSSNRKYKVGDTFDIEEIAFYSEYYQFSK